MTDRPIDNGVPLRVVVALGLSASLLARCIAPALPGLMVGMERTILWTGRVTALLTMLAATGLVAGLARLATLLVAAPRAPLLARVVVVPAVALGCMLLLFASFRPLEPLLALALGITSAIVGGLSARHSLADRGKRAGALVLGLISMAGLVHVLSRKLTQDASDALDIFAFRTAQWIETLGVGLDLVALALALVWLRLRTKHGRIVVPVLLGVAALVVVSSLRASAPGASTLSLLLGRGLERLSREQSSILPLAFSHLLNTGALLAAAAALVSGGELGLILAACLAARGALDIPIPALMLELAALYLPFVRAASRAVPPPTSTEPVVADTAPPSPPA
ncbi:MAG: hypothetical protein EOO73_17510 [Myxococcales bacterium]|nr:MAG: hypothetical protein EOO73_17510 [Myxococcales bacterium]